MTATNRRFMQCPSFKQVMQESDQSLGVAAPAFGRPPKGSVITLPEFEMPTATYASLVQGRRSVRSFTDKPLAQNELAFILYSTQGIQDTRGDGVATLRPVPSGGARHPFETFVVAKNVEGLAPAIYRYMPERSIGGTLCEIEHHAELPPPGAVSDMLAGQKWASEAPVVLIYSCVPYRAEWRYGVLAHRVMLIDLGHLGQNAMLSCAALGLGSCCIAAYDQKLCDDALGLDGLDEYTVYAVALGSGS